MIKINGESVSIEHFPAGEQRLKFLVNGEKYFVEWIYESESELVTLIYLSNHIKTNNGILDVLYIPYLPNARMDRVHYDDEIFTLKYFCEIINSLQFNKVYINNPHSDVCMALINNCKDAFFSNGKIIHNNVIIDMLINKIDLLKNKDILFYPDNGCAKKYDGVLNFPNLIGNKHRDWETGKILGLEVVGKLPSNGFNVLIVDDICSYGGTFLHAAKKLKSIGADKIYLYVTHCENSILQGELINSGLIEKIYTTKSIFHGEHELIEYIGE